MREPSGPNSAQEKSRRSFMFTLHVTTDISCVSVCVCVCMCVCLWMRVPLLYVHPASMRFCELPLCSMLCTLAKYVDSRKMYLHGGKVNPSYALQCQS